MNFNVNDIKKEIQKLENNDINKKFKMETINEIMEIDNILHSFSTDS